MGMLTARDQHGVPTLEAYRARHEKALRDMAAAGSSEAVHAATVPLVAYVNHGRWVGDCGCGAGVAVTPDWGESRCFGCGAVYTGALVEMPDRWPEVEAELERRPVRTTRNALAGDTPERLAAETARQQKKAGG